MAKILNKFTFITPLMFIGLGFATAIAMLILRKSFDPFVLASWVACGVAEIFFRKQKIVPSNILSILFGLIFVLFIKLYVVDIKNMASHSMEPAIPMNSKVFLVKNFYSLDRGDVVVFHYPDNKRNFVARIKKLPGDKISFQDEREKVLLRGQFYVGQDNVALDNDMKLEEEIDQPPKFVPVNELEYSLQVLS